MSLPGADETDDLDYDGIGSIGMPFRGVIGKLRFESFDQMRAGAWERHAVQVDMSVFAAEVPFPKPPIPERPVTDLRLKPGSAAADRGAARDPRALVRRPVGRAAAQAEPRQHR